jgi:tetratricopeptide (TPR) repeat protein
MDFLLPAIAAYALLLGATYLLTFLRILKSTLQQPHHTGIAAKHVPASIKQLFQSPIQELTALGFQLCGYMQIDPMLKLDTLPDWGVLLYHAERSTYATVELRRPLDAAFLFSTCFYTVFRDRHTLLTLNGLRHALLGTPPNTTLQDGYTPHTTEQWTIHCSALDRAIAQSTHQPSDFSPRAFLQILDRHLADHVDNLIQHRTILPLASAPAPNPEFKLSAWFALQIAWNCQRGMGKQNQLLKQRQHIAKADPNQRIEIPLELEIDGYHRTEQIDRGRIRRQRLGFWILFGSLALFVASFSLRSSGLSLGGLPALDGTTFLYLLLVLVLHEAGHFLAMRAFGYRDTSMFFLPFFGAAVTGHKDNASLSEKVWVLLAGPLPGLVMGIALLIAFPNFDSIQELSWMLVGVNLFNLLPIYPLDGGKIANHLIFSRFPFADVAFKLFAIALLCVISQGSPFLLVVAVVVGLSIPADLRAARLDRHLRRQRRHAPATDPNSSLQQIFAAIREFGYSSLSASQRHLLAKNLVQRSQDVYTRWPTRTLLIGIYGLSVLGSLAGTTRAVLGPEWDRQIAYLIHPQFALQQEVDRVTATLQQNPQDGAAYIKRARLRATQQNFAEALADANHAIALDPKSSAAYQIRSLVRHKLGDPPGAAQDQKQAETFRLAKDLAQAEQRITANPLDASAYLLRAETRQQQKQYAQALADYGQVLKLTGQTTANAVAKAPAPSVQTPVKPPTTQSPKTPINTPIKTMTVTRSPQISTPTTKAAKNLAFQAYLGRAALHQTRRQPTAALQDVEQALRLNAQSISAYELRAEIRQQLGDRAGAQADTQRVEKLLDDHHAID